MNKLLLADNFSDLDKYLPWSLEKERQRTEKRETSTIDEIKEFYSAVFPRMKDITSYLDTLPFNELPPDATRLFYISLSLIEVSNLVERYKRRDAIVAISPLAYKSNL